MARSVTDQRVEGLHSALYATFDLYRRTHLAHFNIRGPWFPQLHQLLDDQYNEIWQSIDALGERIRALGESVDGEVFAGGTPDTVTDGKTLVRNLAEANRELSRRFHDLAASCDETGDPATADLCIGRIRAHEQHAWMLEAMLEAQ